jgi:hypothetical protein
MHGGSLLVLYRGTWRQECKQYCIGNFGIKLLCSNRREPLRHVHTIYYGKRYTVRGGRMNLERKISNVPSCTGFVSGVFSPS